MTTGYVQDPAEPGPIAVVCTDCDFHFTPNQQAGIETMYLEASDATYGHESATDHQLAWRYPDPSDALFGEGWVVVAINQSRDVG